MKCVKKVCAKDCEKIFYLKPKIMFNKIESCSVSWKKQRNYRNVVRALLCPIKAQIKWKTRKNRIKC